MNTTITDLLPVKSNIHGTPFEDLVNNTIGYFLELIEEEVANMNDGCFIENAEGKYLDLWGNDYGIPRLNEELDEDYRKRLKVLPLEQFTIQTIYDLYTPQLLCRGDDEGIGELELLSDNHYLSDRYWIDVSEEEYEEIQKIFVNQMLMNLDFTWKNTLQRVWYSYTR